jgi:hypothetical protein
MVAQPVTRHEPRPPRPLHRRRRQTREGGQLAIVAAPNGGVFVALFDTISFDSSHACIVRHSATGEPLWSIDFAGVSARDAAFGPDGLLYVLQGEEVRRYVP